MGAVVSVGLAVIVISCIGNNYTSTIGSSSVMILVLVFVQMVLIVAGSSTTNTISNTARSISAVVVAVDSEVLVVLENVTL